MSRSTKIVVVTLVVGSLAGLGVTFAARIESAVEARREAEKPVEVEPPRVRVEPLARHSIEAKVSFSGTLEDGLDHAQAELPDVVFLEVTLSVAAGVALVVGNHEKESLIERLARLAPDAPRDAAHKGTRPW